MTDWSGERCLGSIWADFRVIAIVARYVFESVTDGSYLGFYPSFQNVDI